MTISEEVRGQVEQEASIADPDVGHSLVGESLFQWHEGFWGVFTSTFVTVFLAEIGDKTQVATLLMSAESQSPWIVFLGAGIALITTSLLGVVVGRWISCRLSPRRLEVAMALMLLTIAVLLIGDLLGV